MTGPELGFLAFGLVLGIAAGITIATFRRALPPSSNDVRVTVTAHAIPRRSVTLSTDGSGTSSAPARGGPADDIGPAEPDVPVRTPVRSAPLPILAPAVAGAGQSRMIAVPMGSGMDPLLNALRRSGAEPSVTMGAGTARPDSVARPADAGDGPARGGSTGEAAAAVTAVAVATPSTPIVATAEPAGAIEPTEASGGPCAELRLVADERCEVATRARQEAERAQDTLRAAQRSYDEQQARAEAAARAADPRLIRAAKDAAQEAFRTARARAGNPGEIDAAAREWLLDVNRINGEARSAGADASRAQEAARALAGSLDRLTVEADAARIAAAAANEACVAAREAAADCDEAQIPAAGATMPLVPSGAPGGPWLDDDAPDGEASALGSGSAPTIFRLLEGDRESMRSVVDRLSGDDPEQRRAWQLAISNLVDAILATAIEGAALDFPEDHPFWGPFSAAQSRDIVAALASLGYRYDGLGGWQDGRIPSQRDLSLALGYAGMDPMRMRHWPTEAEMAALFEPVRVAAPEYLAGAAGDLTLGELVAMLGPRADGLTEVWNAWGRIRPLLLEER